MCNNIKTFGAFSGITSLSSFHHDFQNNQNLKNSFKLSTRATYKSLEILYNNILHTDWSNSSTT